MSESGSILFLTVYIECYNFVTLMLTNLHRMCEFELKLYIQVLTHIFVVSDWMMLWKLGKCHRAWLGRCQLDVRLVLYWKLYERARLLVEQYL